MTQEETKADKDTVKIPERILEAAKAAEKAFKAFLDEVEAEDSLVGNNDFHFDEVKGRIKTVIETLESAMETRAAVPLMIENAVKAIREYKDDGDVMMSVQLRCVLEVGNVWCENEDWEAHYATRGAISQMYAGTKWYDATRTVLESRLPASLGLRAIKDELTTPDDQDQLSIFTKKLDEAYIRLCGYKVA
jgi:hypothetical protein